MPENTTTGSEPLDATRRVLLSGAGAAAALALAGCPSMAVASTAADEAAPRNSSAEHTASGRGVVLCRTSEVPEGGGKIFRDKKVVVTQPTAGEFRAFSAVCTHQGCTVSSVTGGTINCPCHGSKFAVADGSVKHGPARSPLPAKAIHVENDTVVMD